MSQFIPADAAAEGAAGEAAIETPIDVVPGNDPAAADAPSAADTAAEPAAEEFGSVHDYLMSQLEGDQPAADPDPAASEATKEPAVEPKADADAEPKADADDQGNPEDPAEKAPEAETEAPKILTLEEIDAQFPRAPKELRAVAAQQGEIAKTLQAKIDALGGDHFAEPMKLIAEGLQGDDNIPIIQGVMQAQGVDGVVGLMADFIKVGLIDTLEAEPKNEGEKYFQDQCKAIADEFFKTKYGEHATSELVSKLLKYEAEGLLNTADVDEYYGQEGQGAAAPSPLLQEKEAKIAELQAKLDAAEATGADAAKGDERRHADSWEKATNDASEKVLNDLFYKRSVLRDVATDIPEIKEAKAQVRALLSDHIGQYQKADPRYSRLKSDAYKGNTQTAKYQKQYSSFIDDTLFEARKIAGPLEKAFNLIYTLGQNGRIGSPNGNPASAGADNSVQAPKDPTETHQPEKKEMGIEDWRKHMERELAGN